MIIAIVLGAACVVIGIIYAIKCHEGEIAGCSFLGGLVVVLIFGGIAFGIGSCDSLSGWETSRLVNLVAVKDGSSTYGSFFIGCGSIDEVEYYFFYYETISGGIKKDRLLVRDVTIYEDDSVRSHIKQHEAKFKSWKYWIFAWESPDKKYSIYVPKGSVKRDFVFDLE